MGDWIVGLLLGALSAILIGFSDLNAQRAGRYASSFTVVRTALLTAGVLTPLLYLFVPGKFIVRDIAIAAASGILMAIALALIYQGYKKAKIGIVAPTSSVLLAMLPVVSDVVRGVKLEVVVVIGLGIGIAALIPTSYSPGGSGSAKMSLFYGATSGVLFGTTYILLARVKAIGLTAVVAQRWGAFVTLALILPFDKGPLTAWKTPARKNAIFCGVFAGAAMSSLQIGFQRASAGLVSVASSQFATVTVVLAVLFNKERLRWWQGIGVSMTAVAVLLMALG
jgi:drug/metabolite transporter (DMT)-like permease